MISPVSFGAGPSTTPARPSAEEVAKRLEAAVRNARTTSDIGESRVRISPEGAQRAQADAQAVLGQQDETVASAPQPTGAAAVALAAAGTSGPAARAAELSVANDLAFAAADGNRDGTVTVSEQQNFEVRTVRLSIPQPADGRPGPAGSGPIRAYLEVNRTIADT